MASFSDFHRAAPYSRAKYSSICLAAAIASFYRPRARRGKQNIEKITDTAFIAWALGALAPPCSSPSLLLPPLLLPSSPGKNFRTFQGGAFSRAPS